MKKIEAKASRVILQKSVEVHVGDEVYLAAPPTVATIIHVSELISQLPKIQIDNGNILYDSLSIAKDCRIIGDIMSSLILGYKRIEEADIIEKTYLFGLIKLKKQSRHNQCSELANKLLENVTPSVLYKSFVELLTTREIADFFSLTASLLEINLLQQTREVGTTAFGR